MALDIIRLIIWIIIWMSSYDHSYVCVCVTHLQHQMCLKWLHAPPTKKVAGMPLPTPSFGTLALRGRSLRLWLLRLRRDWGLPGVAPQGVQLILQGRCAIEPFDPAVEHAPQKKNWHQKIDHLRFEMPKSNGRSHFFSVRFSWIWGYIVYPMHLIHES